MAIVEDGVIKVDGEPVGREEESKYPIPSVINVNYDQRIIYHVN